MQPPVYVFGPSVDASIDPFEDRLELLKLVAAAPRTDRLAYSWRRQTLEGLPPSFADAAAANGFFNASEDAASASVSLQCVVCGVAVSVERQVIERRCPEDTGCSSDEDEVDGVSGDEVDCGVTFRHRLGCQFQRLLNQCAGKRRSSQGSASPVSQRLTSHLRREMASTKVMVARELSYEEDAVCTALGVRFLSAGEPYPDAGSLVDDLTDLVIERSADPLSVVRGLAQQVSAGCRSGASVDVGAGAGAVASKSKASASRRLSQERQASSADATEPVGRQTLLEETAALYTRTLCRECVSSKVEYVALPCGHLSLCRGCAKGAGECPSCQQPVVDLLRTFGY